VAEVLNTLRADGVNAPILLTGQHEPVNAAYTPPAGLEVQLTAPESNAAQPAMLRVGSGQLPDAELTQRAQRDKPVLLQVDAETPFGDVVHVADVCQAAGSKVYLGTPAN
jgi:hypothetical protein